MRICYLDAFSGISGDMTVGALVDAGADADDLFEALAGLGLGATFSVEKTNRRGIAASKFQVGGGETRKHRHLQQIIRLIALARLPERVKHRAERAFLNLGEAEAKVHGISMEKVHFHEVGAVDSICDIVGACMALELLRVEAIYCSALNVGGGTVKTEHGVLPVPAPATTELLRGVPVYSRGPEMELTTPTGAALAVALSTAFGPMPPMRLHASGYGAGDKDFPEHANVLRATIGDSTRAAETTTVTVLEANIDDCSPQVLGYAVERLLEAGALDVTLGPLLMKKNRPGTLLRVIGTPADQEALAQIVFAETSTLGLRLYTAERRVKARKMHTVDTPFGQVTMKVTVEGDFAPEYEDCRKLAMEKHVPLRRVLEAATLAYLKTGKKIR